MNIPDHRKHKHTTRCLAYWCRDDLTTVPNPLPGDAFGNQLVDILVKAGLLKLRFKTRVLICGCHILREDAYLIDGHIKLKEDRNVTLYTRTQLEKRRERLPLSTERAAGRTRSGQGVKRKLLVERAIEFASISAREKVMGEQKALAKSDGAKRARVVTVPGNDFFLC